MNVKFFDWDYLHLTALMKETYFKSKIGSVPKEKDPVITNNLDPLEISKDNSVTIRIIEFVPLQEKVEKVKEKVQSKVTTDKINNLNDNSSMLGVAEIFFEKELLSFE